MFWGLNLKPNRKYSQTSTKSFHISQAALDSSTSQGGATQIFISSEDQKFLVCTLRKDVCEQAMLDLNFQEGNEISFQSVGNGNVSLTGYLIENDPLDDFMTGDEEEEESDAETDAKEIEDLRKALNSKKSKKGEAVKSAKAEEEEDDDESDSDFNLSNEQEADSDDGDEEEDDDSDAEDDDEDDSEEESDEEEEVQQPKAKQMKLDKPQKQQNGVAKESDKKAGKKEKQKEVNKKEQKKEKPQQQQQKGERTLSGGVKIEDLRVGSGPEAVVGKRAQVYYEGRLKSNNKVFDSLKQGAGFKFALGRGEVIKGWDIGVVGMKVGGKRRIMCPPHMAYGARGSPPTIPPNSTLMFEVELKGVN